MNEIIIKAASGNRQHPNAPRGQGYSWKERGNQCKEVERKVNMSEVPNLQMKMLRKGRLSEKKYLPPRNQSSLGNASESSRKKSQSVVANMRKVSGQIEQRTQQTMGNIYQPEVYFKRSYTNIKNRRLFLNNKQKTKEASMENIGKISQTTHVCLDNPHKPSQKQNKISYYSHQKSIVNLSKSESCKARPISLINPQQLFQAHKATQVQQSSRRFLFRLNRQKDRQLYEQAMGHLYEMARRNFFNEKARSEMPTELDVNKIAIPRRNCKEEWMEKLKKYQESAVRQRKEHEPVRADEEKSGKGNANGNARSNWNGKREGRTKTDVKFVQQETTRNETEHERNDFWLQVMEKPFSPWEYWQ